MRSIVALLSLVSAISLAGACGRDDPHLHVTVGAGSYARILIGDPAVLRLATVSYDITNDGGATVLVQSCDQRISATIEKRVDEQWEPYASGICLANLSSLPVPLRERDRQHGDVGIADPGRFRIRIFYGADASENLSRSAASNAFDVR
jgi:hypothetical protein